MGLILPNQNDAIAMGGAMSPNGMPMQQIDMGQVIANIAAQVFEQLTVSKVKMKYKKLTDTAKAPTYATEKDTCADLYADEDVVIPPHSVGKISTGLAFEAPEGFYFRILPRSGMSSKGYIVTAGI